MREVVLVILVVVAGLSISLFMVDIYVSCQCRSIHDTTGKVTRYANFDACYVKTADGWQRWDEYKRAAK